jgi:hypothetical protein
MNIKQTIKKVSALATGVAMLGATVMGAVAYDLSNYPYPYIQDGAFSGKLVIGTKGTPAGIASDYAGMVDIATSLQAAAKSPIAVSGGTVTVQGGQTYDDQPFNGAWTGVTLKQSKLDGFEDSTFSIDSKDIDYHDELSIPTNATGIETSAADDSFGADPYMVTRTDDPIQYKVVFDDLVPSSEITSDNTMKFNMLGKQIEVTNIDQDTNLTMTVKASSDHFMEEGDSVTIDGHKVTLQRVGETSVIVDVDGQTQVVDNSGNGKKFDEAGNFEVAVNSIFYVQGASDNGADLSLGNDLTQSVTDGDSAELFGQPKDEQNAEWIWRVRFNETSGAQWVGLEQHIDRTDLDCNSDTERCAIAMGDSLDLPNNYAKIDFYGLKETADYAQVSVQLDDKIDVNDGNGNSFQNLPGAIFTSDTGKDDFVVDTNTDTSTVYVLDNGGTTEIWYKDGSDEVQATSAASFKIKRDTDVVTVTPPAVNADMAGGYTDFSNLTQAWSMDFGGVDTIYFWTNLSDSKPYFGLKNEDESAELKYVGSVSDDIGSLDYTYVTDFGAVLSPTQDQLNSGNGGHLEFGLPLNQQMGTIVVESKNAAVSNSDTGAYEINPIGVGAVVKDTDALSMLGNENLIVVGGPFVNSVAADLMGNPTDDQVNQMFEPGRAKIKLYASQNAILVAGYNAQDTVGASRVLADYGSYDLTGDEVEVVVPSLSTISVTEPTLPSMVDDIQSPAADNMTQ